MGNCGREMPFEYLGVEIFPAALANRIYEVSEMIAAAFSRPV